MPTPQGLLFKVIKQKTHDADRVLQYFFFLQLHFTNAYNRGDKNNQNNQNARVQKKTKKASRRVCTLPASLKICQKHRSNEETL